MDIDHGRLTVPNRLLTLIRTYRPFRPNNNRRKLPWTNTNTGTPYSHWRRAFGYARPEDWTFGAGVAAIGPVFMLVTERYAPSFAGKGAFPPVFRLSVGIGLLAGAGMVYQRSCRTSSYLHGTNTGSFRQLTLGLAGSEILRLDGERPRGEERHERNGR